MERSIKDKAGKCGIAMEASYPIRTGQKPPNPGPSPPSPVTPELVCDEYNTCPEAPLAVVFMSIMATKPLGEVVRWKMHLAVTITTSVSHIITRMRCAPWAENVKDYKIVKNSWGAEWALYPTKNSQNPPNPGPSPPSRVTPEVFSDLNPFAGHLDLMREAHELFRKGLLSEAALEAEVLKNPDTVEGSPMLMDNGLPLITTTMLPTRFHRLSRVSLSICYYECFAGSASASSLAINGVPAETPHNPFK
ncbi:low-temperature-induced cysteine proteinase-like protein [Tanacetum coccineum]